MLWNTTRGTVLFIVSGARLLTMKDSTFRPTGYWAEELLTPYRAFRDAGFEVDFATAAGHQPVPDPLSLREGDENELAEIKGLTEPLVLDDVEAGGYAGVFVPAGTPRSRTWPPTASPEPCSPSCSISAARSARSATAPPPCSPPDARTVWPRSPATG